MIGCGFLLAGVGVGVTGVLSFAVGIPAFGPLDLIFLTAYVLAISGFLLIPHAGAGLQSKIRVLLDGLIGCLSVAILIGVYFLPGIRVHLDAATPWERFAGVSYPLLDSLMVVVALIVTIRRSAWRFDIRIAAIGIAMTVQALADLMLLNSGIGATLDGSPTRLSGLPPGGPFPAVSCQSDQPTDGTPGVCRSAATTLGDDRAVRRGGCSRCCHGARSKHERNSAREWRCCSQSDWPMLRS